MVLLRDLLLSHDGAVRVFGDEFVDGTDHTALLVLDRRVGHIWSAQVDNHLVVVSGIVCEVVQVARTRLILHPAAILIVVWMVHEVTHDWNVDRLTGWSFSFSRVCDIGDVRRFHVLSLGRRF